MATLKQRVHRMNSSGSYDTIHYETSADVVIYNNTTAAATLTNHETRIKKLETDVITIQLQLGFVVNYSNTQWIVVHLDTANSRAYLMRKEIYSITQFGSSTTYNGSTLSSVASTYQNTLSSDFLSKLINVTCKGVTRKVFVPTYSQVFVGNSTSYDSTTFELMHFDYFPNTTNGSETRIGTYNGSNQYWWTSSAFGSGYVWFVGTDGSGYGNGSDPSGTDGFRPFVCLDLTA